MKPQLLIIDDDEQMLKMLVIALRRSGIDVATAASGEEGLQQFAALAPDLVIVDIAMPLMNGYEVIRRIRQADQQGQRAGIIVLTAHTPAMLDYDLDDIEIDLFLTKPVPPAELLDIIWRVLQDRAGEPLRS